jgi:hypothetical protein
MSRNNSDSVSPSDRDKRTKSSLTGSGTLHFKSFVALPKCAGSPVERDINTWASSSVSDMLGRVKKMARSEYLGYINEWDEVARLGSNEQRPF